MKNRIISKEKALKKDGIYRKYIAAVKQTYRRITPLPLTEMETTMFMADICDMYSYTLIPVEHDTKTNMLRCFEIIVDTGRRTPKRQKPICERHTVML